MFSRRETTYDIVIIDMLSGRKRRMSVHERLTLPYFTGGGFDFNLNFKQVRYIATPTA